MSSIINKVNMPAFIPEKEIEQKDMSRRLAVLVVVYGRKLVHSETLSCLEKYSEAIRGAWICIWNNGPFNLIDEEGILARLTGLGLKVKYIETPDNYPLSWIYNKFAETFDCESFVFLDHDSSLSEQYLKCICESGNNLVSVPRISSNGEIHSPLLNGRFRIGPYRKSDKVVAIGSGICVNKKILKLFNERYGDVFDERFALYGVDTTFFRRLLQLELCDKIKLIAGFEHSLSRLEDESREVQEFRRIERSYDFGLMLRWYPDASLIASLVKQILLAFLGKSRIKFKCVIEAFWVGRHRRCNSIYKKNFMETVRQQGMS